MDYEQGSLDTKKLYPFEHWRGYELEAYTDANCDRAKQIFDDLISKLVMLGESAGDDDKVACFKFAVLALNDLESTTYMIETGEREELCELIDAITVAASLDPEDFGDGEGMADEWRSW